MVRTGQAAGLYTPIPRGYWEFDLESIKQFRIQSTIKNPLKGKNIQQPGFAGGHPPNY
jgi:hypothetical protein